MNTVSYIIHVKYMCISDIDNPPDKKRDAVSGWPWDIVTPDLGDIVASLQPGPEGTTTGLDPANPRRTWVTLQGETITFRLPWKHNLEQKQSKSTSIWDLYTR